MMPVPFPEELDQYRACGFQSVELWLDKISRWMAETSRSPADACAEIERRGVRVIGACAASIKLNDPDAPSWEQQQARLIQRLELTHAIGARCLAVTVAGRRGRFEEDFSVLVDHCKWLAHRSSDFGVCIALEFLARIGVINSLSTAVRLIREVDHPNFGLLFDLYHFWLSESRTEDLKELPHGRLFLVHVDDARDLPLEWLTHNDRTFPGEGAIPIRQITGKIANQLRFAGPWSIELHSDWIWRLPREDVVRRLRASRTTILTWLHEVLGSIAPCDGDID